MPNSYTDIFGGGVTQTSNVSYSSLDLLGNNAILSWPTQFQNTNDVVYQIMDINPGAAGVTVTLSDATLVSVGITILISNVGINNFNLLNSTGGVISPIAAGASIFFYLTDNTTPNGIWRAIPFGAGAIGVTSVNAVVPDATDAANMGIAGGPITLAGVFNFSFAGDIAALIGFGPDTGISVREGLGNWSLRSVIPAPNGNLTVVNGDGVGGDITIDTSPTLGIPPQNPINQIRVGNISITANSIESQNADGDILLSPNGIGTVEVNSRLNILNGNSLTFANDGGDGFISFAGSNLPAGFDQEFLWPTTVPANGQVLQYNGLNQLVWANVTTFFGPFSTDKAIARFNGAGGQIQNSTVILADDGSISTPGSLTSASISVGNIRINSVPTSVITTNVGDLVLNASLGSIVNVTKDLKIGTNAASQTIIFQSGAFSVSLSAPVIAANVPLTLPPTVGAPSSLLESNGAGVLSFTNLAGNGTSGIVANAATTAAATNGNQPVVPLHMKSHPGVAKVTVSFVGSTGAMQYSYNVAAVNRTGVGTYTITFVTNFSAADYVPQITIENNIGFSYFSARGINNVSINTFAQDGVTRIDPASVSVCIFGSQ